MTTTSRRNPAARLKRLQATDRRWIVDYGLWKLNRLEDRIPRATDARLRPLQQDVLPALVQLTGLDEGQLATLRTEFADLRVQQQEASTMYGVADANLSELEYVVTRALRPAVVVETGVWRGLSSWSLLAALSSNDHGRLVSIDFPPLDEAQRVELGHLVPETLRHRWTLEIGPSRQVLPRVLERTGHVDVFVHDSDHTTANMTREFRVAWRAMPTGGVLLSDDIEANHAFLRFARHAGRPPVVVPQHRRAGYLGMLRKA